MDSKVVLACSELNLTYDQSPVLSDLNLELHQGEILSLIGPSGCGKSSLLTCLNGLIHDVPYKQYRGDILYQGQTIAAYRGLELQKYRREVALIFQKPTLFPYNVFENLKIPLVEFSSLSKQELDEKVERVLNEVSLWEELKDRLHKPALALSGGQQQRLCLARTLILEPKVLLLDEPCSSLDPMSTEKIESTLRQLKEKMSMILVTHNLAQAKRMSDRTAIMWPNLAKSLVEIGETSNFFTSPQESISQKYIQSELG